MDLPDKKAPRIKLTADVAGAQDVAAGEVQVLEERENFQLTGMALAYCHSNWRP